MPVEAIPAVVPDLTFDLIMQGNTSAELERKRQDYFRAGTRGVWEADHRTRSLTVYTPSSVSIILTETDTLTCSDLLPDFKLPLRDWFGHLDDHG